MPKTANAAACPWSDNDSNDNDATVGTYEFKTAGSPYNVVGSATAYDCTSGSTGITLFKVPSDVTINFSGNTATGDITRINFTNLQVDSGGSLSATAKGCTGVSSASGYGPNGSNVCTSATAGYGEGIGGIGAGPQGAGYGGTGGLGSSTTYDAGGGTYGSPTTPTLFGSGGGGSNTIVGGTGGGVVRIDVASTLTHNGQISANGGTGGGSGGSGTGGGGSGGSVYVTVGTLAGSTGTFEATGGNGGNGTSHDGGGGGGGRIALVYNTSTFSLDQSDFIVTQGSKNGTPDNGAVKGTVYVVDDQGTSGDTTDDVVTTYHGFTYDDTDYGVASWTAHSTATNQYCATGATSPSIAAAAISLSGSIDCSTLGNSGNFNLASSGTVELAGLKYMWNEGLGTISSAAASTTVTGVNTVFSAQLAIGQKIVAGGQERMVVAITSLTSLQVDSAFDPNLSAGTVFEYRPVNRSFFNITSGDVAVTGNSQINTNVSWTGLSGLNIESGSYINADDRGCPGVSGASGYGPDGSNVCLSATAGYGVGRGTGGGEQGGGYGGRGGLGSTTADSAGGATYGSPTTPTLFGSSGGGSITAIYGGSGGGIVRLDVSVLGTFTHNGTISANGRDGFRSAGAGDGGGGSGGSVYVTVGTLAGASGKFEAKGGDGGGGTSYDGGGGGGGRIALTYKTSSFGADHTDFDVSGGIGPDASSAGDASDGGKGTVYTRNTTTDAVTVFHGFSYDSTAYSNASWTADSSATNQYCTAGAAPSITAATISLSGIIDCNATGSENFSLSSTGTITLTGLTYQRKALSGTVSSSGTTVTGSGTIFTSQLNAGYAKLLAAGQERTIFTIPNNTTLTIDSAFSPDLSAGTSIEYIPFNNTFLNISGGAVTLTGGTRINSNVSWTGLSSLTINAGSWVNADGQGCVGVANDGFGPTDPGNVCTQGVTYGGAGDGISSSAAGVEGAGHGGAGGLGSSTSYSTGGNIYDSSTAPLLFGSSGGGALTAMRGGRGGGVVRIDVTGTFTVNGTVSASGWNGFSSGGSGAGGGGSGGSVYVTVGTIAGTTGLLESKGGSGGNGSSYDGGGGGGGLIYYGYGGGSFSGTCDVSGGTGPDTAADGAAGTCAAELTAHTYDATTANTATLSRLKAGQTNVDFALSFTLQNAITGTLTVTFPAGFAVTQAFTSGTCASGTIDTFGLNDPDPRTLTAEKTNCSGLVTLSGAKITNHATPGSYTISWVNDDPGSTIITILSDDQITVTANIQQTMTFDVGVNSSCASATGGGGTVALGDLTLSPVTTGTNHVCLKLETNADGGAVIQMKGANGGLRSPSLSKIITTAYGGAAVTLSGGTEGFGLCISATSVDSTTPTSVINKAAPYDGACGSHAVGGVSTSFQNLADTNGNPADGNSFQTVDLLVKAAIASTTPAATDYAETLTFRGTSTF